MKKPALQANVTQVEEQIIQYKQFAASYEERLVSQKAELEKAHKEELDAVREKAVAEAKYASKDGLRKQLLSLSKFLCAAAAMRRSGDETSSDSHAFEGVLYQVYGGSQDAVNSMVKLVEGADEKIISVEGTELDITCKSQSSMLLQSFCLLTSNFHADGRVKEASESFAPTTDDGAADTAAAASDPTLANAASTELQDTAFGANAAPSTDPNTAATVQTEHIAPPAQTMVSSAANPVADSAWDPNSTASPASANTEGWVEVPRDPAETDSGLERTPATVDTGLKHNPTVAQPSGQEAENAAIPKKQQNGDGFEPVGGHQRQSSGRGRGRGRGRGDGFRGRGRGDFRGRGRGRGGGSGGRGRGGSSGAPAPTATQ